MDIIYRTGDVFAGSERCLIHGCNARGVMGSGVARIMRERHPAAYQAYRDAYQTSGLRLGEVIWATSKGIVIGNAITQDKYGTDKSVVYANYDAIRAAMRAVNAHVGGTYDSVAMPQIGAGLANGNWWVIAAIIEAESRNFQPIVYVLDQIDQKAT